MHAPKFRQMKLPLIYDGTYKSTKASHLGFKATTDISKYQLNIKLEKKKFLKESTTVNQDLFLMKKLNIILILYYKKRSFGIILMTTTMKKIDSPIYRNIRVDISKCHQSSIGRLSLSFKIKDLAPFNTLLNMNGIICNLEKIILK